MSAAPGEEQRGRPTVLVVGSGWRMTSGISYYTCRLANALAGVTPTAAVLMRQLVPSALYPGRKRVGQVVNDLGYDDAVEVHDGVDWFWGASMLGARALIARRRPDVVVLQWWTGAVLHSYLALAWLARRRGARVVVEWHEVQDTGEARVPGAVRYVRALVGLLLRMTDAHVVHSRHDAEALREAYGLDPATMTVVPHGPYDHVGAGIGADGGVESAMADPSVVDPAVVDDAARATAPAEPMNLLFFGVIRPYKGLEDLVEAFEALPAGVREGMRLTVVGEPWEGYDAPLRAIAASPAADRITLVDRYVTDAEVSAHFAAADAVVLPYRRSSASGPLHVAMSAGLPVVVTDVGGLVDAADGYEGAVMVPPRDPAALAAALADLPERRGHRYADARSWDDTVAAFAGVLERIGVPGWERVDA